MGFSFNPLSGELDLVGGEAAAPTVQTPNYTKTFVIADFTGPVSNDYSFVVLASTHGKGLTPVVQVLEKVVTDYVNVLVYFKVNTSGDITISVPDSPDSRFDGKLIVGENN